MQSSVEPLYVTTTRLLKELYHQVCTKKNLPVDVISYVGDADETKVEGDTIYIKCDNKLSIDKHRVVYKYIYDHPEYDVIIKTNVSTVLNLELLCKYVASVDYYSHNFYGTCTMWDSRCAGTLIYMDKQCMYSNFPVGFFHMAKYDIWKELYEAYDDVTDQIKTNIKLQEDDNDWPSYPGDKEKGIIDVNDDLVMGALLVAVNRRCIELVNYIKLSPDDVDNYVENRNNFDSIFGTACIRCKLAVKPGEGYAMREYWEPKLIYLAAKLYEGHDTNIEDLRVFLELLKYFML